MYKITVTRNDDPAMHPWTVAIAVINYEQSGKSLRVLLADAAKAIEADSE